MAMISRATQARIVIEWYDNGEIDHNQAYAILDILERDLSDAEREHKSNPFARVRRLIESDMA
jgi:hypothetical protein